jgi:hypothetical protein
VPSDKPGPLGQETAWLSRRGRPVKPRAHSRTATPDADATPAKGPAVASCGGSAQPSALDSALGQLHEKVIGTPPPPLLIAPPPLPPTALSDCLLPTVLLQ